MATKNIEILGNTQKIGWAGGEYFQRTGSAAVTLTARLSCDNGAVMTSGYLQSSSWPTSDPAVAGQVWNDDGLMRVSSG